MYTLKFLRIVEGNCRAIVYFLRLIIDYMCKVAIIYYQYVRRKHF